MNEQDPFPEAYLIQQEKLERARRVAEQQLAAQYAADPARHAFALGRGQEIAGAVQASAQEDTLSPTQPELLTSALTALTFTFTNPRNHSDTLSYQDFLNVITGVIESYEEPPHPDVLADHLNLLTAHLFIIRETLARRGTLPELPMSEQLPYVYEQLGNILSE